MSSLLVLQETKFDLLVINGKNNETILRIDYDGVIYFRVGNEIKKLENEKELSQLFVSFISGMVGNNFDNKEDLFKTIAKNYRLGKIDKIFEK